MDPTKIFNRETKDLEIEKTYGEFFLKLSYGNQWFAKLFHSCLLPLATSFSFLSEGYGFLQKSKRSRGKIKPFIKKYDIDANEFEKRLEDFSSFNDFFIRKLKEGSRTIDSHPDHAIMPADARYLVAPSITNDKQFSIKNGTFNLTSFLDSDQLASSFEGGSMAIARLCPLDYHRFHFPFDCRIASPPKLINGSLYSVSPWALKKRFSILSENKRVITMLDSDTFGSVAFVEIGATCVGTIHQTFQGTNMKKGDEKGYFSFGGSCIVMLFEKGRITFDNDLITYSKKEIEVVSKWGTQLGMLAD